MAFDQRSSVCIALDANEQAQLLDSLIGDLRGDLLETQQQPPADALALATRLADHGDLMRAALMLLDLVLCEISLHGLLKI